jgi:hypothetical protein
MKLVAAYSLVQTVIDVVEDIDADKMDDKAAI